MSWSEFCSLLGGIMHDTPLGSIIAIRAEKDQKKIKEFSPEQRKIRNDWILKRNAKLRENPVAYNQYVAQMQNYFKKTFGKEG